MNTYHKTWWGEEFVRSLEEFIDPGRLQRGKAYRTDNRILAFNISDNKVTAKVRGNINPYYGITKEPIYNINLSFNKIPSSHWEICIEKICKNPSWLSKLILNEIPKDIQSIFEPYDFLPRSYKIVEASCSCPDYDNPCKHIAGIYYRISDLLDITPMLIFPLRGMQINDLHMLLKKSELGRAFSEHLSSASETLLEFDESYYPNVNKLESLEKLSVQTFWGSDETLSSNLPEEGDIEYKLSATLIKKQGDYPPFWNKQNSFIATMESFYQYIKRKHKNSLGLL
jgi:hypothetical protein